MQRPHLPNEPIDHSLSESSSHLDTEHVKGGASNAKRVDPKYRVVLWLVALGFFMQALDTTIVNTALPSIAVALHVDPLLMHHVVVAYVLTVAVLIPASGWLADRFGIKKIYLSAIVIFTLGSLACGIATSYSQLIAGRVLQGVGGAFLLPVGRLALLRLLPREQFLAAMGFIALPGLLGPMLGPTLGGVLVQYATWHWIFLINLPIGIVGAIFTVTHMPNVRQASLPQFDYRGFILLAVAMVALTLGLERGKDSSAVVFSTPLILLLVAVSMLLMYYRHAQFDQRALFRADLFSHITFRIGIIGNIVSRIGSSAVPFLLPLTLQLALGFTPLHAGLMMIPLMIGAMSVKQLAPMIIDRFGYCRVLVTNTLLVGLGIMSFGAMNYYQSLYIQVIHLFLFGCVNSLQFTAMNTLTLKDLSQVQSANGNSLLSMVMNLAMSLSVAIVGFFIQSFNAMQIEVRIDWTFQMCFLLLGLWTMGAALVFRRLNDLRESTGQ